jgi:cytochrome c551/c552
VPPTYAQDILPILRRRCFQCHAGDGAAAEDHNFSRFATFYAQRRTVADQIAACTMPPPSQPTIPTDEADAILRWVACGGIER